MRQPEKCKHCGQIIPPQSPFRPNSVKQRIYDFVAKHPEGTSSYQIADHVYQDDPDGGSDVVCIRTHIWRMNQQLRAFGVRVHAGSGRYAAYTVMKI